MNAHQRRIEKRLKARSAYPSFTEFKSSELNYGLAAGAPGVYRIDRKQNVTHFWLDFEVATEAEKLEYEEYVKREGYYGLTEPKKEEDKNGND